MSQETLDDFALRGMDHGPLTGISVGMHAIPDAFLLMHTGVGCKHKATSQLSTHDWAKGAVTREAWTEVGDGELIRGSSERIGPYARSWLRRLEPAFMGIVSVTFIDLSGEGVQDEVRAVDAMADCPVRYLKAAGHRGDLWVGYATLVHEIAKLADWKATPDRPREVTVLGYFFDRYEGDHAGNLAQIKGLLKLLNLSLGPVLLSGRKVGELTQAGRSGVVVCMPYVRPAKRLKRLLSQRRVIHTELPMGVAGTSAWVRQVGQGAGVDPARIEAVVASREARVWAALGGMTDRWRAMKVAIYAEAPLAVGLVSMALELGFQVAWVGLRGTSLGGREAVVAGVQALGLSLSGDCVILENPSLADTKRRCQAALEAEALDGVFAASTELNALSTLSPKVFFGGSGGRTRQPQGPFMVEIGFPAKDWHTTHSSPFMGWGGVLVMAQRIVNAPRLWNAGRQPVFFA